MSVFTAVTKDIFYTFFNYIVPSGIFAVMAIAVMNDVQRRGFKNVVSELWKKLIHDSLTQKRMIFFLYVYFMIDYTLLSRSFVWRIPLSDIMDGWTIVANPDGTMNYEAIENFIFFIPFSLLFLLAFPKLHERKGGWKKLGFILAASFGTSFFIETVQLIFKIGTFQISDLTYNTLGGVMGGLMYLLGRTIKKKSHHKT
ncbi:MAG: VanZ family protein [Eubacterium sp.]